MTKSKQQKQEEALARKRQNYNNQLDRYMDTQPGGKGYQESVLRDGLEKAKKRMDWGRVNWVRYLVEARLDPHGNPVTVSEHTHLLSFLNQGKIEGLEEVLKDKSAFNKSYWP